MEIIPVKEIFSQKGSLGGAIINILKLPTLRPVHQDPQGAERHNFQNFLHNSHYTHQIGKCSQQKLKSVKFSTKKVPITLSLGATVVAITEQQPNA